MIKAVIFDVNGIFVLSPKLSERFEKDFGVGSDIFVPKLKEILNLTRQPRAENSFNYWSKALAEWNIKMSEEQFWAYWFGGETVSEKMVEFAKWLRKSSVKVFLLSNNFMERAEHYGHYSWLSETVDKTYYSWQTGFIKPDVKAWQNILDENGLSAADVMYFDDEQKNVDAANSLGIKSFLFTNEEDTERLIKTELI